MKTLFEIALAITVGLFIEGATRGNTQPLPPIEVAAAELGLVVEGDADVALFGAPDAGRIEAASIMDSDGVAIPFPAPRIQRAGDQSRL